MNNFDTLLVNKAKMQNVNVLIVDDSKKDILILSEKLIALKDYNFNIFQADTLNKAAECVESEWFDIIFLDYIMNDGDGIQFLLDLTKDQKNKTPIVFVTGFGSTMVKEDSLLIGAKAYLDKNNLSAEELKNAVSATLH